MRGREKVEKDLAIAFGALIGAGAAALVSIGLGEGRGNEAERILGNTVVLNMVLGTAFSALMLLFLDDVPRLFGASPDALPHARAFMGVILVVNPMVHTYKREPSGYARIAPCSRKTDEIGPRRMSFRSPKIGGSTARQKPRDHHPKFHLATTRLNVSAYCFVLNLHIYSPGDRIRPVEVERSGMVYCPVGSGLISCSLSRIPFGL